MVRVRVRIWTGLRRRVVRNKGVPGDHFSYLTRTRIRKKADFLTRTRPENFYPIRLEPRVHPYPWLTSTITITVYSRKKSCQIQQPML